jgi:phosphoribosylformylglycinamidine synthase
VDIDLPSIVAGVADPGLPAVALAKAGSGLSEAGYNKSVPSTPSAEKNPAPVFAALFSEELGAVIQIRATDLDAVNAVLRAHQLDTATTRIGTLNCDYSFRVKQAGKVVLEENLSTLRAVWSDVTRRIAALRDNPACAESEYQLKLDPSDPGIRPVITFDYPAGEKYQVSSNKYQESAPGTSHSSLGTWNLALGT